MWLQMGGKNMCMCSAVILITFILTCHHGDSTEFIVAWSRWWPMMLWQWIFNRNILSLHLFASPPFPFLNFDLPTPVSVRLSVSVCLHVLLFLPQSPACQTSQLPQELSSLQITQKAMGTTWTVSGSSNQIQAPESTWHLMTLTSRHPMIP